MLSLTIPARELYDERTNTFIYEEEQTLELEHSLLSLSKWESKWCKPFLGKDKLTYEQTIDYVRCMTLNEVTDPRIYDRLTNGNIKSIEEYIEAPMTATWFSDEKKGKNSNQQITNELIYYWMVALQIPFECEKWHLNRLFTLIKVCNAENKPKKKMSQKELLSRNAALNAARRKQLNSKG